MPAGVKVISPDSNATPAPRHKLATLEIGRFIAASVVMFSHITNEVSGNAATPGQQLFGGYEGPDILGVQYFFVLSGFVMLTAHYGDFGSLSAPLRFWWRRAIRIFPAYWLALIIPVLFHNGPIFYYTPSHLTPAYFTQLFTLAPWQMVEYVPPAWTLRFEMSFYIMFGLCLLPRVGKPLLALWIAFCIWHWCPHPVLAYLHISPVHPYIMILAAHGINLVNSCFTSPWEFCFFCGLGGGLAFIKLRPSPRLCALIIATGVLLAALLLPHAAWGRGSGSPVVMLCMAFSFACILFGLAWLERLALLRPGKFAARLGAMSYPLYILHMPILLLAANAFSWLHLPLPGLYALFAAYLAAIYTLTWAATVYFDQPIQRALRRIKV
jgi:peptidoglycan/LPS O-acetylase OafA/YrhL